MTKITCEAAEKVLYINVLRNKFLLDWENAVSREFREHTDYSKYRKLRFQENSSDQLCC